MSSVLESAPEVYCLFEEKRELLIHVPSFCTKIKHFDLHERNKLSYHFKINSC